MSERTRWRIAPAFAAAALVWLPQSVVAGGLEVQKVVEGVYALVGEIGQRSPQNLGNNATFGVVVTDAGVVLIDPGGSYEGARQIHRAVADITDKPVVQVINTGGQDHRWLGNAYFKERGARIVAAEPAVADQKARARDQLNFLYNLVGEAGMAGTHTVHADRTFEGALDLDVGGVRFELRNPAPAHTPGDTFVWLPQQRVVFTGDIVYVERMLTVSAVSKSRTWLQAFEAVAALDPLHVVPGHGGVTTLDRARADTYQYLAALRKAVGALIDGGVGIEQAGAVDQSRFARLKFYEDLKGRNAQQVYQEMEWE